MAVKGKGKQIAGNAPSSSASLSSGKRKKVVSRGPGDRRRKRRAGVLQFFDDAAQDAEYDEEEEDKEEEDDLDCEDEDLDTEYSHDASAYFGIDFSKVGSEGKEFRNAGKPQYLPFLVKEEELSGDELEELIKDRYGRASEYVVYDEDPKECDDGVSVEHSAEDQKIWRVKCMVGREQQMVLCLMHKYADLQRLGTKMEIISAFALEHVKGYVYIEADKACDIVEACKGFFNIYATRMGLVPSNEIPHLLSTRNKPCTISKGTWVRMKNGNYKGDLGQVVDYDDARKRATIKLVPRIDLQAIAKKYGGGVSLKEAGVPVPRLISSQELEHFRSHIEIRRDRHSGDYFEILDGLMLKDGYLYKKVSIASIVFWGVQPSKDELLKFTEMSKAEEEDVSWLSSVYNVRKKLKSLEAEDRRGASEQGNGFNLHDLVLFGRKGFGVIIDLGKDGIKILKGETAGHEVMTIKSEDIKSRCVDKMFTASDRHRKNVYINDIVKVLEGPLEGKEGTVRHMYKGTLFIYDENQEENSGIFCAKSDICENITPPKDSSFRKGGNKSGSSFNQSPVRSCEQEDSSCTFSRSHRRESNQPFSIGQTLRIRKGPLKGYLCRVVRIYRSDVTVKLDSLVKVITVDEQFLSIPNIKRDFAAETSSDIFGTPERLLGGLSGSGEQTVGTSSWDGASSSWQALSKSTLFVGNNDQKTEQEQGGDPWGSKVSLAAGDHKQGADPWGSKSSIAAGDLGGSDPWGSKLEPAARDHEQGADPWCSNKSISAGDQEATDPWGSKLVPVARDKEHGADAWGRNAGGASTAEADKEERADPWGGKMALGDSSHTDKALDSWAKVSSTSGGNSWNKSEGGGFEKDGDVWNKPFVKSTPPTATGSTPSGHKQGADLWGSKISVAERDDKQGADPWGSKPSLPAKAAQGGADPWANNMEAGAREQEQGVDPWGNKMATTSRDKAQKADLWGCNATLHNSSHSVKMLDSWEKAPIKGDDHTLLSNKTAGGVCKKDGDGWNKPSAKSSAGPSSVGNVASSWELAAVGAKSEVEGGAEPSSWDKVKVSGDGQSVWDTAGWGKVGPSTKTGTNDWPTKPSDGDQVSDWKKGGDEDPWSSRMETGAREQEQGDDPWGNKMATTSRDKAQKADLWGSNATLHDSSHSDKALDSWEKAPIKGDEHNLRWNKTAGGVCRQDGDGWNKPSAKSSPGPSSVGNVASSWEMAAVGAKSEVEGGAEPSSWDKVKVSGDSQSVWDAAGWGKVGPSTKTGADDWKTKPAGGDQVSDWKKGGDEDSWMSRDPDRNQGFGWGKGSNWNGGANSREGQDNDWNKQRDFDGGRGSSMGRGRGRFGARRNGDEVSMGRSGDFDGCWGSGGGRGWGRFGGRRNGDEYNQDSSGDFGGVCESGRGRGRYGGRGTGDEDNLDGQVGFGGGWGPGRGRGRGRYGGRGIGDEDNQDGQGGFGRGWGSGRGRGRGRYGGRGTGDDDNQNGQGRFSGGWGSGRGRGRGQSGERWGRGSRDEDNQDRPGVFCGGWGSGKVSGQKEQEHGADPWGSNTVGATDKEQKDDLWGGKAALGDPSRSDNWVQASSTDSVHNSARNKAVGGGWEKDGDDWNKSSVKTTPSGFSKADEKQVADPWGSKASLPVEDQGGADPWGSKLASGARGQGQGADPWGINAAATSGDKETKADPWGCKAAHTDTSHSDKALDSWGQASNAGVGKNSSLNNAAGGGLENDDGWNKPSVKNIPVPAGIGTTLGGNAASGWAVGAKSTVEHGGETSSWDEVKSSSDAQSAGWGKAGSSTKNGTDGWNNSKCFGGDQLSNWMKGGDENAWKSEPKDSWDKPSNFPGGREFYGGRGRGGNSWDKPIDCEGGQGSGWGRGGSDWNGLVSSHEGRDFDGDSGFGRGKGILGPYRGRGNRNANQDSSGDFRGGWGSGSGRGGGWNGD